VAEIKITYWDTLLLQRGLTDLRQELYLNILYPANGIWIWIWNGMEYVFNAVLSSPTLQQRTPECIPLPIEVPLLNENISEKLVGYVYRPKEHKPKIIVFKVLKTKY
jgi:hypothetical protein